MAAQKKTSGTKKAVENKAVSQSSHVDTQVAETSTAKKVFKFDDSVLVNVQSNVFGELIYTNPRNGDTVRWPEFGDTQPMTIGDLRAMRGTQRNFFENNWIFIKEVLDAGYEDATPEDVYKALMVSQYYKDILDPENFNSIFRMDDDEMVRRVRMMSDGAKMNLIVASNEAIVRGKLDSLRKIKLLEDLLNCDLMDPA